MFLNHNRHLLVAEKTVKCCTTENIDPVRTAIEMVLSGVKHWPHVLDKP